MFKPYGVMEVKFSANRKEFRIPVDGCTVVHTLLVEVEIQGQSGRRKGLLQQVDVSPKQKGEICYGDWRRKYILVKEYGSQRSFEGWAECS